MDGLLWFYFWLGWGSFAVLIIAIRVGLWIAEVKYQRATKKLTRQSDWRDVKRR